MRPQSTLHILLLRCVIPNQKRRREEQAADDEQHLNDASWGNRLAATRVSDMLTIERIVHALLSNLTNNALPREQIMNFFEDRTLAREKINRYRKVLLKFQLKLRTI